MLRNRIADFDRIFQAGIDFSRDRVIFIDMILDENQEELQIILTLGLLVLFSRPLCDRRLQSQHLTRLA